MMKFFRITSRNRIFSHNKPCERFNKLLPAYRVQTLLRTQESAEPVALCSFSPFEQSQTQRLQSNRERDASAARALLFLPRALLLLSRTMQRSIILTAASLWWCAPVANYSFPPPPQVNYFHRGQKFRANLPPRTRK